MAETTQIQNAGVQTTSGTQQNNNAPQNPQQPVQGTVNVTGNGGNGQQGAPAGMTINLDPAMLQQLLSNPQVQAGLANGQTVQLPNAQQQAMMQNLQGQGVQVPQAPTIPGTAPAQNPQQPAEKPGFFARIKNGVLQFIINHPGWTIVITVAASVLVTLGCVWLYNRYFGKTTSQAVADNQKQFEAQKQRFATENANLTNRDNYQKVGLGNPTSVAKSLCMRLY